MGYYTIRLDPGAQTIFVIVLPSELGEVLLSTPTYGYGRIARYFSRENVQPYEKPGVCTNVY